MMTIHNIMRILGDSRGAVAAEGLRIRPISRPHRRCVDSSAHGLRVRSGTPVVTSWSLGIVCAVVFLELLSRQLTSNLGSLDRPSPASSFQPDPAAIDETYKVHWCSEGCATSHFSRDGARITNNPILNDAPIAVVLGDSHIEALQVSDSEITASVIESMARTAGSRINVREYGWSAASVPAYVAIAPKILAALNPRWVAVVLTSADLGSTGLEESRYWRARLDSNGEMRLFEISDEDRLSSRARIAASAVRITRALMRKSTLLFVLVKKTQEIIESRRGPAPQSNAKTSADQACTQASVRALKSAYGSSLLIFYVPELHVNRQRENIPEEAGLLTACATEAVRCASMRQDMMHARDTENRMCTGFNSTEPGTGHLNAYGHAVLANLIWRTLRANP